MDDRRIEELLRESFQPQPPEGMRERVLGRAGREAGRPRSMLFHWPRLRVAFAAACLLFVLVSAVCDMARQARLQEMVGRGRPDGRAVVAARPQTLGEWRMGIDRLIASDSMKGDESP